MFLYSDQCGGFCVCNIMSRMSGHVYPQSFMILNVFTIMFDLVHMQSQSFQMIFQSLMTSYQSVILFFSAQVTGFHLEMGLLFRVILLFNRGEPLSKFFLKCVFWPPLSNEGSDRCSGVFVFEIFAFKVFGFIQEHFAIFSTFWSFITWNHNSYLSDHYQHSQHSYLVKRLAFVVCLLLCWYNAVDSHGNNSMHISCYSSMRQEHK